MVIRYAVSVIRVVQITVRTAWRRMEAYRGRHMGRTEAVGGVRRPPKLSTIIHCY